jgi:tetratricopeptide (TPR) repeat protein
MKPAPWRSQTAGDLVDGLLARPEPAQRTVAGNSRAYWRCDVGHELIRRSLAERHSSPKHCLLLAELAHAVGEATARCGSLDSLELRAEALAVLGNARKIAGDFSGAEDALLAAERLEPAHCPLIEAQRLEFLASLRTRQSRFPEAIEALKRAVLTRHEFGDVPAYVGTLIQLAIALHEFGEADAALRVIIRADRLIDHDVNPRLALIARHYGALILADSGQPHGALTALNRIEWLYAAVRDPLMLLRRQWVHARIAGMLGGDMDSLAEEGFRNARESFQLLNMNYEAAEITLELARLHAERDRLDLVASDLRDCLPIFDALGIERESLAGRMLLNEVGERAAAVTLLQRLGRQLAARAR